MGSGVQISKLVDEALPNGNTLCRPILKFERPTPLHYAHIFPIRLRTSTVVTSVA